MQTSPKIKMQFVCDQDFDLMSQTEKGRFCNACQREVLDLRHKSKKEIQLLKDTKGKVCGVFLPEQVEDIYPLNIPLKKTIYFATFITLFGINSNDLKAQNSETINTGQDQIPPVETKKKITGRDEAPVVIKEESVSSEKEIKTKDSFYTNRKYKYYLTKKFPFITRKSRRRTMGFF